MSTIRDFLIREELALDGYRFPLVEEIEAAGTSEGAQKGWDSRGRGRNKPQAKSKPHQATPTKLTKPSKKIAAWAKAGYDTLKNDDKIIEKLEKSDTSTNRAKVKQIGLKTTWFAKRLGDLTQSFEGFRDMLEIIHKVVETLVKAVVGVGGVHEIAVAVHHASVALGPVVHHLITTAGSMSFL